MTNKTQETMPIASKCTCGKHPYYCGNDCPFANPFDMSTTAPSPPQPEAQPQQEGEEIEKERLKAAHFHGWFMRERLDTQDTYPYNFPAGLDYEEKQQWLFEQFYNKLDKGASQLSTLTAENAKLNKDFAVIDEFTAENNNVEWDSEGNPLYSYFQVAAILIENAKLWKALEEQYKYHLQFVSESSVGCDEMDGYLEHNWEQFKSNLLAK